MAVGVFFDSDSFSTFNKELEKFDRIATSVDTKLGKMAVSFEKMFSTENTTNITKFAASIDVMSISLKRLSKVSVNQGALEGSFKAIKNLFDLFGSKRRLSFFKGERPFDSMAMQVNKFSKMEVQNLNRVAVSIKNAFITLSGLNKFNLNTDNFSQGMKSLREVIQGFTDMGSKSGKFSKIMNVVMRRSTSNQEPGIIKMISEFSNLDVSKMKTVIKQIGELARVITELKEMSKNLSASDVDFDVLKKMLTGFTEMFSGEQKGVFGKIKGFAKGLAGADVKKAFGSLFNKEGIIGKMSKLDTSGLSKFKTLGTTLRSVGVFLKEISSFKVNQAAIVNFTKSLNLLLKGLSQKSGRFGAISRMFTGKSIFTEIGKIKIGNLSNLNVLSKAFRRLLQVFTALEGIRIDEDRMKTFLKASKNVIKELGKIAKSVRKLDVGNIDKLAQVGKNLASIFKDIAKGFSNGMDDDFEKVGKKAMDSTFEGMKKSAKISSPSKRAAEMAVDVVKGFGVGFKKAGGLLKSFGKKAISGLFNAMKKGLSGNGFFDSLKKRFTITLGDVMNIARSFSRKFYKGLLGNAVDFESAFAGVLKTLDTGDIFAEGGQEAVDSFVDGLRTGLKDLSSDADSLVAGLEGGFEALSTIAELGGQLGINPEGLLQFTEVIGQLTLATDLSEDAAATALARFTNITGTTNFEQIGASLVALGNSSATTESQILNVTQRIAAAGVSAGLSEQDILGWSAAIASSGVRAELGSTAFTKFSTQMFKAANSGGAALEAFATQAGMSMDEFTELVLTDANAAIQATFGGLGDLSRTDMIDFLEIIEASGSGVDVLVSSLSTAERNTGLITNSLTTANEAFLVAGGTVEEYNALQAESAARSATTASAIERVKNTFLSISDSVGQFILPAFNNFLDAINRTGNSIDSFIQKHGQVFFDMFSNILKLASPIKSFFNFFISKLSQVGNAIKTITDTLNVFKRIVGGDVGDVTGSNEAKTNALLREREKIMARITGMQKDGAESFIAHTFEAGETLSQIAEEYGVSVEDILEASGTTLEEIGAGITNTIRIPTADTVLDPKEMAELQRQLEEIDRAIGDVGSSDSIRDDSTFSRLFGGDPGALQRAETMLSTITAEADNLKSSLGEVFGSFVDIVQGDVSIIDGITAIGESFKTAGSSVRGMLEAFVGRNESRDIGGLSADMFGGGDMLAADMSFGTLIKEALQDAFDVDINLPEIIGDIFDTGVSFGTAFVNWVADGLDTIATKIEEADIGTKLSEGVTAIIDKITPAIESGFASASSFGSQFVTWVGEGFSNLGSTISGSDLPTKIHDGMASVVSTITSTISSIGGSARDSIMNALTNSLFGVGGTSGGEGIDSGMPGFMPFGTDETELEMLTFGEALAESMSRAFAKMIWAIGQAEVAILQAIIELFTGTKEEAGTQAGGVGAIIGEEIQTGVEDSIAGFNLFEAVGGIASFVKDHIVDPFIDELSTKFKETQNADSLGEALGVLFSGAMTVFLAGRFFFLMMGKFALKMASALVGSTIIGWVGSALGSLFAAAIPLAVVGLGALLIALIFSEEFRNEFSAEIGELIGEALGNPEWVDDLANSIGDHIILPVVQFVFNIINDLKSIISVLGLQIENSVNDVKITLLGITEKLGLGGGDERSGLQDRAVEIEREIEILRALSDIRDMEDGAISTFKGIGGFFNPEDMQVAIDSAQNLGLAPFYAEQIATEMQTAFDTVVEKINAGEIGMAEGASELVDAGLFGAGFEFVAEEDLQTALEKLQNLGSEDEISAFDSTFAIGNDVMRGLMEGITEGETELDETVSGIGTGMIAKMEEGLEIKSPSEAMARIGDDIIAGLSMGMTRSLEKLKLPLSLIKTMFKTFEGQLWSTNLALQAVFNSVQGLANMGGIQIVVSATGGNGTGLTGTSGGRRFGGSVSRGNLYEILEGDLPFEVFETGNRSFFIPNTNGTIIPPVPVESGGAASLDGNNLAGVSNNNISNSNRVQINVPITFANAPIGASSAELDDLANTISMKVQEGLEDISRENTLNDRLNAKGVL